MVRSDLYGLLQHCSSSYWFYCRYWRLRDGIGTCHIQPGHFTIRAIITFYLLKPAMWKEAEIRQKPLLRDGALLSYLR